MISPFVYGRIAEGDCFLDREVETAALSRDFQNLTNTILISPRRWGKSSLIRKAAHQAEAEDPQLRICFLDIFNVRTEDEFYEKLASTVLKATSSMIEELFATAKKYLSALVPIIKAGDIASSFSIRFEMKSFRQNADDILDLVEKIAREKNLRIVVCIDEFQQIASFDNPGAFQAKLRSHWQLHQHVAYCLYGSRRHMMMEVFTYPQKPFYHFGKTIFLEKIDAGLWPPFIQGKFRETGKVISRDLCEKVIQLVDNNPYYIQQLCEEIWNRTVTQCDENILKEAFDAVVTTQSNVNQAFTNLLSLSQQNLLKAIVYGEKELTSRRVLEQYDLKNSLTVSRAKKALVNMDVIDNFGKVVTMEDPIYAWWLKNIWFNA